MIIISEIGTTPQGDVDTAKQLIDISKECGVDAVKMQIIRPEKLSKIMLGNHLYQTSSGMKSEPTLDMMQRLAFEDYELIKLSTYARDSELDFFVTEDFVEDVWFSNTMDTKFHKICRGTWRSYDRKIELLSEMLGDRKKTIIDVYDLSETADIPRHKNIWVQYFPRLPVTEETIKTVMETLNHMYTGVGYSTPDNNLEQEMVAKKYSSFMEKILTLDKTAESPDNYCAAEPEEFKKFVEEMKR